MSARAGFFPKPGVTLQAANEVATEATIQATNNRREFEKSINAKTTQDRLRIRWRLAVRRIPNAAFATDSFQLRDHPEQRLCFFEFAAQVLPSSAQYCCFTRGDMAFGPRRLASKPGARWHRSSGELCCVARMQKVFSKSESWSVIALTSIQARSAVE